MSDLERIKELLPKFDHSDDSVKDFIEKFESNIEPTPMVEENKEINSRVCYEKAFYELFSEILDFEKGFYDSKENYTNALLNAGVKINSQSLYQLIDLINNRLVRVHLVKRLCGFLGLHNELDKIVERELDLVYKTPQYNVPKQMDTSIPIAGEYHGDR